MKKNILNIPGVEVLSKENLLTIKGQAKPVIIDLSLCGCDCAGSVTGPSYCSDHFGCLQVYTCNDVV